MELACGYRPTNEMKMKSLIDKRVGLNSDAILVIKLPSSRFLRVMSRSLFLAMVLLALPSIGSLLRGPPSSSYDPVIVSDSTGSALLPSVFQDLGDEGLLKKDYRTLLVSSDNGVLVEHLQFLNDNGIASVIDSDLESQSSIADEAFDIVFTRSIRDTQFIDRVLKIGGIVVMQLSSNPSNAFQQRSSYKIVYLRRFSSTVVAMRKLGPIENSPENRRLCGVTLETKEAALRGLEGAMLEPPRRALYKSNDHMQKINFLPDLLRDSLEGYPRRVFIWDEQNTGVLDWFYENYPKRNQYFETYNFDVEIENEEMAAGAMSSMVEPSRIGISDWLKKNVRKEDYVVMKAEAQLVEEMMREKSICLVDELFLECKNQWQDGGEQSKSKRAYWECLALYGRLRDEGIAVHQWWG